MFSFKKKLSIGTQKEQLLIQTINDNVIHFDIIVNVNIYIDIYIPSAQIVVLNCCAIPSSSVDLVGARPYSTRILI